MTAMPVTIQERIPIPINPMARAAGAGAGTMTFGDVMRVFKQRIFLILFSWISITVIAVGLTIWLEKNRPSYTAASVILVESPFPRTPFKLNGETLMQVELMNRWVNNQAVLVKEEEVLRLALGDAQVRSTAWYRDAQAEKRDHLETLKHELSVKQLPDSSYLQVSMSTRKADDAPIIVNAIVTQYLAKVQNLARTEYTQELTDYNTRLEQLRKRLAQIRSDKENFVSSQLGVPGVIEGLNVVGEMWRALATEATRLEAEALQYKTQYENLKGLDPAQITITPQMMMMVEQDPQIASMNNAVLMLDQERQALLKRVGPNHRAVASLDSQLASTTKLLNDIIANKQDQVRQYQISSAETAWLNAWQAYLQLDERVKQAEAQQRDLDRKLAQYRALDEEQALLEQQYNQVWAYTNQLEMMIRDREMVRVKQVSTATPPKKMSFPRYEVNIPAGSFLGLLIGVGLAVLLEIADTSIRTARDIARHIHMPILGTVPDLDDEEVAIERIELAAHTNPRSMMAEAFRTIRANLLLSSPAERQRSVLVTSSKPEEGKTTIAVNLAIAIAQSGRRVLLIDANFHRPALRTIFADTKSDGLSNILVGQGRLENLITSTGLPNLDVLASGPIPPNPAELLAGSYLRDMIHQASERYDQLIFDGPPVLLVSDAVVLSGVLDGVILVCRAKDTSRGVVVRAREQLERVNTRIFGAVLNAARVSRGGYFREQIRSYYDYQPEEVLSGTASTADSTFALPAKDDPNRRDADKSDGPSV